MRISFKKIVLFCILSLWLIVFPWTVMREILQIPNLYSRWLQIGDVYPKFIQSATLTIFRTVPQKQWSPWITNHPDVVQHMLELAVDASVFEKQIPLYLTCWGEWWVGERQQGCVAGPLFTDSVGDARWEAIRAYLWESLPSCEDTAPPACKPVHASDQPAAGQQQIAWWAAYRPELVESLVQAEESFIQKLPTAPTWIKQSKWAVLAFSLLSLAVYFYIEPAQRVRYLGMLFTVMGTGAFVAGLGLAAGFIRTPVLRYFLGLPSMDFVDMLLPQIWPALAYLLGNTLIFVGCVTTVPGLLGLYAVSTQRNRRIILLVCVLSLLALAYGVYPATVLVNSAPPPTEVTPITPTAFPTFTPSPTPTPTLTPQISPVTEQTPLPAVNDVWWSAPVPLFCTEIDTGQIKVLHNQENELWGISSHSFFRISLPGLKVLSRQNNPAPFNILSLAPTGNLVALAEEGDVWLYTLPDWQPAIRSRITTLSSVVSLLFTRDTSRLVQGLDNGYLWISNAKSGELLTLFSAHQVPVVALANAMQDGYIYSGATDGTLTLWNINNRRSVQQLTAHHTALLDIIPTSDGQLLFSLDASGRLVLWDAEKGTVLRERAIAALPSSTLSWVQVSEDSLESAGKSPGFLVGGMYSGQVFMLDQELDFHHLTKFDNPVSVVYPVSDAYLVVGMADGLLCIVGTP